MILLIILIHSPDLDIVYSKDTQNESQISFLLGCVDRFTQNPKLPELMCHVSKVITVLQLCPSR